MEGRSHDNTSYAVVGQLSRMAQDLQDCSDDFKSSFKPRLAIRKRASLSAVERVKSLRVCVVGAGLAGLRCAQLLVETGVNTTLLEARYRIGGRVHQELLDGTLVDMGPNWVHGTESNPIVQLAGDLGIRIRPLGEQTQIYEPSGDLVDDERSEKLNDVVWEIISEAFGYSNKHCADIPPELSLKDFFLEQLPKYSLNTDDKAFVMRMAEMWGSFIGDNWDRQSLKWFWLEECLDGENLFVVDTHKAIIDRIADSLRSERNLKLGAKVTRIENLSTPNGDPRVRVTVNHDGDNIALEFDEVVVAVPLGCLKRNALIFSPPLPPHICTGIENASISSLEKIFVTFPRPFWDSNTLAHGAVADDPTEQHGDHGYFAGFANFLNPSYAPKNHESFALEVNSLSNRHVFGNAARPTLVFSLFGDSAHEMTSAINSLAPLDEQYFSTVNGFVKPYYSRLPNYDSTSPECAPSAVLATNWQNDDLAGNGSYTNFKVRRPGKEVLLDDDVRVMRFGMPERGIWLAGEHVAPFIGLGTSTGAYWSGESVAMRILGANGIPTHSK